MKRRRLRPMIQRIIEIVLFACLTSLACLDEFTLSLINVAIILSLLSIALMSAAILLEYGKE